MVPGRGRAGCGMTITSSAAVTPQFTAASGAAEPLTILAPDGTVAGETALSVAQVLEAIELMHLSRAVDAKGFSLQRQGRFGTFSPLSGQEASVVGAALALDPTRDWVVPQYRELPALLRQGFPLEAFLAYFTGKPAAARIPDGVNVLPLQIGLAAQIPHAVGLAWGLRQRGKDGVVLVFFGDGASSEGDFHEAVNLAGVVDAPVVFLCQNNGWAISTPRAHQSRAATLAARAPGYGIDGWFVDGNDLFAVYAAVSAAVDRARHGGGPSLVETVTYRMGPHNTADDPSRYQDAAVLEDWRSRDPITRVEAWLASEGRWDDGTAAAVKEQSIAAVEAAVKAAEAQPLPGVNAVFEEVVADPWPRLETQRRALREANGDTA